MELENRIAILEGKQPPYPLKCVACHEGQIRDYHGWETCPSCKGKWKPEMVAE